jgi:hypothetical protein
VEPESSFISLLYQAERQVAGGPTNIARQQNKFAKAIAVRFLFATIAAWQSRAGKKKS